MRIILLLAITIISTACIAEDSSTTTVCRGGFDGQRDLLISVYGLKAVTQSSQAILLNKADWLKIDETDFFTVYKLQAGFSFNGQFSLLVVSNTGQEVSYFNAANSSHQNFFEMEEFRCSGF